MQLASHDDTSHSWETTRTSGAYRDYSVIDVFYNSITKTDQIIEFTDLFCY